MPTSVGPNTFGEENLVFGYDTGDTVNSYKGEPTEPLRGTFPTDTELPTGYHWTYEYDHEIVDAPVSGHFLSNKKWIKSTRDTTGSRRVLFLNNSFTSGSTYTFSCYVYSDDSRLTSLQQLSHNGGYSAHQGGTIYASADLGTVKRIHGTWIQQQNGSSIYGMQTNNAALGTTFYMTGLQVEEKANPTQLTAGSRSADSGSLIDLTGNTTIDLSNVSFDSNAQMEFDGTDDYAFTSATDFGTPSDISFECVIRFDGTLDSNDRKVFHIDKTGTTNAVFQLRKGSANRNLLYQVHDGTSWTTMTDSDAIYSDTWAYFAVTHQGTSAVMYKNGVQTVTATMGELDWTNVNNLLIGYRTNSEYWKGDIAMLKLYSRGLTATEIKSNYNAIKGRFNI